MDLAHLQSTSLACVRCQDGMKMEKAASSMAPSTGAIPGVISGDSVAVQDATDTSANVLDATAPERTTRQPTVALRINPASVFPGQRLSFVYSRGTRAGQKRTARLVQWIHDDKFEAYDEDEKARRQYVASLTDSVEFLDAEAPDSGSEREGDLDDSQAAHAQLCCTSCLRFVGDCCKQEVSLRHGDRGAERLTTELEKRAMAEADRLVAADGSICGERLALLLHAFDKAFAQRVLSRVPFSALAELGLTTGPEKVDAVDAVCLNTALHHEDFRELAQWQEATESTTSICPMRNHILFEDGQELDTTLKLYGSLVPTYFEQVQPTVPSSGPFASTGLGRMIDCAEFLSLMRAFSCGILENLPFHPFKLILGGSTLPKCVRRLTPQQQALCHAEASATDIGSNKVHELRQQLRDELHTTPWQDTNIDLFVFGEAVSETTAAVVRTLQRNISSVTNGAETVVLRTKNTLSVVGGYPIPHVQLIWNAVRSAQELLNVCDVDCSAMAYDGEHLWAATRALRALGGGYNFVHPDVLRNEETRAARSAARIAKYIHRGFGVLCFEHCKHFPRCDHRLADEDLEKFRKIQIPKEWQEMHGDPAEKGRALAQMMLATDLEARSAVSELTSRVNESSASGKKRERQMVRSAGFADLLIPWGPGICAETLRAFVRAVGRDDLVKEIVGTEFFAVSKNMTARRYWQGSSSTSCYMCRQSLPTYQSFPVCKECSNFNKKKRQERPDCSGMVAMVTGGRMKIGFESSLRLLRAGATVVVTSRFARVTLDRYREEKDFHVFRDRLVVLSADFRRIESLQQVIDTVLQKFDRLDVLIHNAAQSIRRPPVYYESLLKKEKDLGQSFNVDADLVYADQMGGENATAHVTLIQDALSLLPMPVELHPLLASDKLAEIHKAEWFPVGRVDPHGEQLDLRPSTSWTMKMEDTELAELGEVLLVNLVAPYLLTARLLPVLRKSTTAFIVFVTSQEGSFTGSRVKHSTHPHTNAAKAGLNMLAKTIAGDLRKDGIYVSAVDPGWVSWMQPVGGRRPEVAPLSEADGAARVLDPIFSGLTAINQKRIPPTGVLFKDFRVAPW